MISRSVGYAALLLSMVFAVLVGGNVGNVQAQAPAGPYYYFYVEGSGSASCTREMIGFPVIARENYPDNSIRYLQVWRDGVFVAESGLETLTAHDHTETPLGLGLVPQGIQPDGVEYTVQTDFLLYYPAGVLVSRSRIVATCSGSNTVTALTITNETFGQSGPSVPNAPAGPGPDMVAIPDTAVVGLVLADTPFYTAPAANATTNIILKGGKTLWVFGLDSTHNYYRVMLAGRFFWVPVHLMGPNPDHVWNNTPLPTVIVQ